MPTWGELLDEMEDRTDSNGNVIPGVDVEELRDRYLSKISKLTGRNVVAYYSGWLYNDDDTDEGINDKDMTGFMNAIEGMDESKGLDLILNTPGGNATATEGIIKYLHNKFGNNIRVIIPYLAMSAGTILACASKEIIMSKHSFIGPIDPQFFNGVSAYDILQEFDEARDDLSESDYRKDYWEIQLNWYPQAFYYSVIDAIELADSLVGEWLQKCMFEHTDSKQSKKIIKNIQDTLNTNNQSHSRHFGIKDCEAMGLKVIPLEDDRELCDAVMGLHNAFTITFERYNYIKIIENQLGNKYYVGGSSDDDDE